MDREEYKKQFGVVKESDLPKSQRRSRPKRKKRKEQPARSSGVNLGKLLKEALAGG